MIRTDNTQVENKEQRFGNTPFRNVASDTYIEHEKWQGTVQVGDVRKEGQGHGRGITLCSQVEMPMEELSEKWTTVELWQNWQRLTKQRLRRCSTGWSQGDGELG